jgi:C1A family cysteine protease
MLYVCEVCKVQKRVIIGFIILFLIVVALGGFIGSVLYSFYDNQNTTTNHATLIIGWDDDYSRDNFGIAKPTKNGAWLCRNTRGENWGDTDTFGFHTKILP